MQKRNQLAQELLSFDVKQIVFIDQANARTEYGKVSYQHTPAEYLHSEVKQPITKQFYQRAEFCGAIKYRDSPGSYKIFKIETFVEKNETEILIKLIRKKQMPRLRTEFDALNAEKDVSIASPKIYQIINFQQRKRVEKRRGKTVSFEIYVKINRIKRSNRDKEDIDWFRLCDKYLTPLLSSWLDKLQEKKELRRATRYHTESVILALNNAAAHKSKQTDRIMNFLNIYRIVWPLLSPDLNLIKYCWNYIRA